MSILTPDIARSIVQSGIETSMYPRGKEVPEDDKTCIKHAEELLELSVQIGNIAKVAGESNAPNWPSAKQMIIAAGLDPDHVLAHGLPQDDDAPTEQPQTTAQAAPEPAPAPEPAAPAPVPQPVQAVATPSAPAVQEVSPPSTPPAEPAPAVQDPMASLTKADDHVPLPVPQFHEIWQGPDPQTPPMRVVEARGDKVLVEFKGVAGQHEVPRAFLATRIAEAPRPGDADYVGPQPAPPVGSGNPVEQQVAPTQYATGGFISGQGSVEQSDPFTKVMTAPVEQVVAQQQPAPVAVQPVQVSPIQPISVPSPDTPRTTGGFPVAEPQPAPVEPVQQAVPADQQQVTVTGMVAREEAVQGEIVTPATVDPEFPLHNTDGDAQYKDLLDEVQSRHSPAGMPIPRDLTVDLPIIPEDLTKVQDEEARAFYSLYNALAARARYLHDLEAGFARACGLLYEHHRRVAIKEARSELGKESTLEEVKINAELDETVTKWRERRDKHNAEAAAFKTFFDINSDNVKVLSRDWTMRDKEQQGD